MKRGYHFLRNKSIQERFEYYTKKTDSCWVWTGPKNADGYGQLWIGNGYKRAHRISYELFIGPITNNILHKCDNPPCVNPEHLRDGTQNENVQDMILKNRAIYIPSPGSKNGMSVLNEGNVIDIRNLLKQGLKDKEIAQYYDVSWRAIQKIRLGVRWQWLI